MKRGLSTGDIVTAALHDSDDGNDHGAFTQTRGKQKKCKKRDANATKSKTKQPPAVTAASEATTSLQILPSTTTHVPAVAGDGRSDTADEQS